jgi:hypothetical protein
MFRLSRAGSLFTLQTTYSAQAFSRRSVYIENPYSCLHTKAVGSTASQLQSSSPSLSHSRSQPTGSAAWRRLAFGHVTYQAYINLVRTHASMYLPCSHTCKHAALAHIRSLAARFATAVITIFSYRQELADRCGFEGDILSYHTVRGGLMRKEIVFIFFGMGGGGGIVGCTKAACEGRRIRG